MDVGFRPVPIKPVIPGILLTKAQLSLLISILMIIYPGKNFLSVIHFKSFERARSKLPIKRQRADELKITIHVASINSLRVDHETFFNSTRTSAVNFFIIRI